jgi:putative transposase
VTDARAAEKTDAQVAVPWSGFDLINAFNAWKRSEAAGRVFVVASDGTITRQVTGLAWRHEVSAQVFEEAAIDLGRALAAYAEARSSKGSSRGRRQVRFPCARRRATAVTASGCATNRVGAATSASGSVRVTPAR